MTTGYTLAWLIWLGLFLAIELPSALNVAKGDTLTEHFHRWFSIKGKPRGWQIRRVILAAFLVALTLHLVLGVSSLPVAIAGAAVLVVIGLALREKG